MSTAWFECWISQFCLVVTLWECHYCVICTLKKNFFCSLIWKGLSESVSIVWFLGKCVVLFGSNSMKGYILFDMKSEKLFPVVCSNCMKVLTLIRWGTHFYISFFPSARLSVPLPHTISQELYILWSLILIFWVVRGVKGWKIVQNEK